MELIQEVTKRQVIDYGTYIEYYKFNKGWSKNSQLQAQDTRQGLKLSGLSPTIQEQKDWIGYKEAVKIFGNEFVNLPESEKRYQQSIQRTKVKFKEIIKANIHLGLNSFLSLTYKDNMQDRKRALKDLENFRLTLKRKGETFEYLAVMEKQKRGAWHFHLILFNHSNTLRFKLIKKIWYHGAPNIKYISEKAENNIEKMANYMTKYQTKEIVNSNKKAYFTTKGINRPIRYNSSSKVSKIMKPYLNEKPFESYAKPNTYLGQTYCNKYYKVRQDN